MFDTKKKSQTESRTTARSTSTTNKTKATAKTTAKKAKAPTSQPPADAQVGSGPIYYVGVGASAGGLEALRPFVANLPAHANMTYIVAQHMSPDHRSLMVELLARETRLKVVEASNNLQPKPDTIYVAPPNVDVTVVKGKIRVSRPTNTIGPKPSVDRFFMSLADDRKDWAIGIILSGTGSDGAHGIKAIKAAGGVSIAQDPKSAKYDSMPNAAIRIGRTDLVLPPHEIANQLRSIVQWPRAPLADEADETPPSTMRGIVRQIATHTGMDFSNYKDATLSRQVLRRMAAMQIPDLDAYGEYIGQHREELAVLAGNFLICVTSFFRDPEAFEVMRRCLRELLKTKQPGDDIRIWVPGCATGEEVYSIAIILAEELGEHRDKYHIQLFATDINGDAVAAARVGAYPEASLAGVDSKLIERYFTTTDGTYHIDKHLRDMTLFARQDLVQDAPFVRLDLVSCRNLLIYFKPELQDRVIKVFHYALRDHGVLFLGKSESIGRLGKLFVEHDHKNKIYLKRPVASPVLTGFARTRPVFERIGEGVASEKQASALNNTPAHEKLFDLYAPASLLMTSAGEILELFGDCSPFLAVRKGKADFNAFTLIKPAFRAELRAFGHRVVRNKQSAICNPVQVDEEGKKRYYRMAVHFAGQPGPGDPDLLLVCFERVAEKPDAGASGARSAIDAERVAELEREVVLNRETLQTVIEELETANEELQSLNEEAQASNEELQASNEELETANEELQASNEELITVNDELGTRTAELSEANSDLSNILNSLYKGLVVVDRNLTVTRYNQIALEFFDIAPMTRPNLTTVSTQTHLPQLLSHVGSVMKKARVEEFEFWREDGQCFLVRVTPYHDSSRKLLGGVVITITDISEKKRVEEKLRLSASVFEHASEATVITDAANQIISVNPAFTTITGYGPEEALGMNPRFLSSGKHTKTFYKEMWQSLTSTGSWAGEIQNRRKNGDVYTEWLSINVLKDENGAVNRHIAVFSDITEAKRAKETIERQASFDSLTGLPNRNLVMDRLGQMLSSSRRGGRLFAVMFMDLDHFKSVNDALGHAAGDELLIRVAHRIRDTLRECDSVGRMGGDEFIVLLNDISSAQDIIPIANKILAEVGRPLVVAERTLQSAASIGVTVYPMDGDSIDTLLKNADSAMYEAKKNGRNNYCFFTHKMQDEANRRHWIDSELMLSLHQGNMELHYQPIVRIETRAVVGAEALLRWKHPAKGYIPPEVFIPVAEQNGAIARLTDWALERGISDWETRILPAGHNQVLAFNLSAALFVARDLIEKTLSRLRESALARRGQLTVEITESLKLSDNHDYVEILRALQRDGCRIAIDDFGTGYSSLSYLRRVPVDIVKIDKTFIHDIATDPADAALIRAILQMANAFGLETVAEGVETPEQLAFLRANGCTYAQGFLFGNALSVDEFSELLRDRLPAGMQSGTAEAAWERAPGCGDRASGLPPVCS
ncbi:MAG: putative methyltransferase CheR [Proteobacteria bacterium]|nr:putative methyltransferase CheR [Pseudomonadota bacterium]